MTNLACESKLHSFVVINETMPWKLAGKWSCFMPGVPRYFVQEFNYGTVCGSILLPPLWINLVPLDIRITLFKVGYWSGT